MQNRRKLLLIFSGLILAGLVMANAPSVLSSVKGSKNGWGMWGPYPGWHEHWSEPNMSPWHRDRILRHWHFMHGRIPDQYRNLKNPHDYTSELYAAGAKIYANQCAQCHGAHGMGDGEAAKDLNPSPSLLAFLIQRPIAVDEYLMWTISDGGKKFGTKMPAFKDKLSRDDIWKVIAYMRAGFPLMNGEKK